MNGSPNSPEPIAIIGMACVYPEAEDVKAFWRNIIQSIDSVGEPQAAWEAKRYLSSGRISTPYGGFLKELFQFDPREFGIMPSSVDGGEPDQFLALRIARDALADAGYLDNDYDHTDTGIVLGHSTYLHRGQGNHIQHHIILDQTLELIETIAPSLTKDKLSEVKEILKSKLPPSNPDIAPGLVPNVMTGRIANRLNLKGPNYILDAACSSSLLAVSAAMDELRNGRSNLMLAGGVNASLPADVSVIFTQLGALSKRGKVRPFEKGSDGTLLGEGLGVVVLKRLSDALEDSDHIYAVIRGVGQASDGKGHGLLAPSEEGEALAIHRAYRESGVNPSSVSLIEAHGTGIPLGDKTEIAALRSVLGERVGPYGSVALGSVKSMISHCIPAAGIAGLIKTALALHHKILPPTLCDEVNPELGIESTPLYINTAPKPWISELGTPRRAGVNSFGFGGINTHAILEEAPEGAKRHASLTERPFELFVFSADSRAELKVAIAESINLVEGYDGALEALAAYFFQNDKKATHRIAVVVTSFESLIKKLHKTLARLDKDNESWSTRDGVYFSSGTSIGKTAFVYPGEGSQYIGMLKELAMYFPEVRKWFDFWQGLYCSEEKGTRSQLVFPAESELSPEMQHDLDLRIHEMDVGSEAVFIAAQAMSDLLKSFQIKPDAMLGHSSGESAALVASGALPCSDLDSFADFIRELNSLYRKVLAEGGIKTGMLLTVGALDEATINKHLSLIEGDVYIAMDNCSNQKVLYGAKKSMLSLQASLSGEGGICIPLPFDRGYHTPEFSAMKDAFYAFYGQVGLTAPAVPLYSCASKNTFPPDDEGVRTLAAQQWSERVCFTETVEKMFSDGFNFFIEVGPSGNLTSFLNDILKEKSAVAIATNLRKRSSLEQFLNVLGVLYVNNKSLDLSVLFKGKADNPERVQTSGKNSDGLLHLENTMPVIHLNEDEKSELRKILGQSETLRDNTAVKDISDLGEHHDVEVPESTEKISTNSDQVMSEYFGLMKDFIRSQEHVISSLEANEDHLDSDANSNSNYPFLTEIIQLDADSISAECHLNVYEDAFLRDHILSGRVSEDDPELLGLSCVPLMVSLEIMAEAVSCLSGEQSISAISNVQASDWITLDDSEVNLEVVAYAENGSGNCYKAELFNAGERVVAAEFETAPNSQLEPIGSLDGKLNHFRWDDSELYSTGMFHGKTFQSINGISGWNQSGIEANISPLSLEGFFVEGETSDLVLNPVLLDALGQLAAYWIAQQVGTDFNSFPSSIGRIELYDDSPGAIEGYRLLAKQSPVDHTKAKDPGAARSWSFECKNRDGDIVLRVDGLLNIFFPVPHNFYLARKDPLNGWLGTGKKIGADAVFWNIPHLEDSFCAQSGGVFLRILAHSILCFEELEEWKALSGNWQFKREWIIGRACIKEATRCWFYQRTGRLLYPTDICVRHDELGAPFVTGWWVNELLQYVHVSLSHDRYGATALVSDEFESIGIDVERYIPAKDYSFLLDSMDIHEREYIDSLSLNDMNKAALKIWCAKEAAAKYLKTGLQGCPENFSVCFMDESNERAVVSHADERVSIVFREENQSIVALAM